MNENEQTNNSMPTNPNGNQVQPQQPVNYSMPTNPNGNQVQPQQPVNYSMPTDANGNPVQPQQPVNYSMSTDANGNPVQPQQPVNYGVPTGPNGMPYMQQQVAPKKPFNRKIVVGIIVAVLALVIAVVVVLAQPKKFNIEDYVEVNYSGYNGYAKANARIDSEALLRDIYKAQKKNVSDLDSIYGLGERFKYEEVIDAINVDITSEEDKLSNGDKIIVDVTYDNEVAKKLKIKFTGSTVTTDVKGLETIDEVNPFDDLKVTFSGTVPNVLVSIEYTGTASHISNSYFEVIKEDTLKNGDIITVKLNVQDKDTISYGYIVPVKQKEYEVSGLDEYIDSFSKITDSFLDTLKKDAEDKIYAYVGSSYYDDSRMSNLEYAGYILGSVSEQTWFNTTYNVLTIIHKAVVSNVNDEFPAVEVYFPVQFTNILLTNGELQYKSVGNVVGYCHIPDSNCYTNGYISPMLCYMELTESSNGMTFTAGDGFEKFGDFSLITKLDDISDTGRQELHEQAAENVKKAVQNNGCKLESMSLVGEYLLVAKDANVRNNAKNKYVVVYEVKQSYVDADISEYSVYFPVVYAGLFQYSDGTCKYMDDLGIDGVSEYPKTYFYTLGYLDGKNMYDRIINANRDNYTYEVSDGLKSIGN